MPSAPLPDPLSSRPFTFAEAKSRGESSGSLRRRGMHRVTHGVHALEPPVDEQDRLAALLLGLPEDVVFSHRTAADLHGMPLTLRQQRLDLVDVMSRTGVGPVRRPGVWGHRGLESRQLTARTGLPVIGAADTWCDFGELIRADRLTVDDLVVVGDAAANVILRPERTAYDFEGTWPEWWTTTTLDQRLALRAEALRRVRATLHDRLAARNRPRGKALLNQALPLVRLGVRSPMETRARLVFHHAGLPEPEVNLDIYDDDGQWIAEGDLVWPEARLIGEYQGAHHADRARASQDSDRRHRLSDRRWRTREIWAEDLFEPDRRRAMLARFAHALANPSIE